MSGLARQVRLPTRRRDWRLLGRTVRLVLGIPTYAGVALVGALTGLTVFVVGQNPALVADVVVGGSLPLADRATVPPNCSPSSARPTTR